MLGDRFVTQPELTRQAFELFGPTCKQLVTCGELGLHYVQLLVALAQLCGLARKRLLIFGERERKSAGLLAGSRESLFALAHDAPQFRALSMRDCDGLTMIA